MVSRATGHQCSLWKDREAREMLLVLLGCLLPAAGAGGQRCLRCWPQLPLLADYDLRVLWGAPGPPRELSRSLRALLLQAPVLSGPGPGYLGQDHLEREAAALFAHIDRAIGLFRADRPSLLNEVHVQKQLFAEGLSRASEELKEQACNSSCDLPFKLEVINCANCRAHILTCRDPTLCPGWTQQTLLWAGSLCVTLALAVIAGGGWYIFWHKKQAEEVPEDTPARL